MGVTQFGLPDSSSFPGIMAKPVAAWLVVAFVVAGGASSAVGANEQTISFDPLPDATYGDPPITLTAVASSGLPVGYVVSPTDDCSVAGSELTLTGAGSCTVTASQAGDTDWLPATSVEHTFSIERAPQTVSFDPLPDATYGDPPITLTAVASSGLPVG